MLFLHRLIRSYGFYLHFVYVGHSPNKQTRSQSSIWLGSLWLTCPRRGRWPCHSGLVFMRAVYLLPFHQSFPLSPPVWSLLPRHDTFALSPGLFPAQELPSASLPPTYTCATCVLKGRPLCSLKEAFPVTLTSPPSLQLRASPAHHRHHCNPRAILP